jgi:hypothetical protein
MSAEIRISILRVCLVLNDSEQKKPNQKAFEELLLNYTDENEEIPESEGLYEET